ncbi:cation diffusion facilitator family transporter [Methylocapsa palsarum]|uniref:Cation diffusion facilitator family transporter n=1 Tax=Methylocapsa palsarum TaxID=1612308 RepID=A0A1I3WZD6_9HYPH|nr:cation diffusion facilitator family transporter [Methylocapsa palsarum]SFK12795.1 cation diffusion facilitator family transporter [Methylocapsa palsarum]
MTETSQRKERAALASIATSAALTVAKVIAGLSSGSLAILSEAGHNLADVATTILTYFAIRIAHKPADDEHPYGHGKVESLAALIETGFLFALSAFILIEALRRLGRPDVTIEANALAFGVLIVSMIVDLIRWRSLSRIARETKSDALAADALHFSSDLVSSALALAGITAAHYGYPQGDAIAALGVAAFVAVAGYHIGRRTVDNLVDAAPKGLTETIASIAQSVPGVIKVTAVRLRPAGAEVIGDVTISVSRTLTLETLSAIKAKVGAEIAASNPEVTVTISAEPIALDDETILERVTLIAAKRHLPIHHMTLQEIDRRTSVSFDVELDGRMTHGVAHEIVTGLEKEIRSELGSDFEVETHIEPLELRHLEGRDAPLDTQIKIAGALAGHAPREGAIQDIHNVRVRNTPAGLVVNYHCRVDQRLTVNDVHDQIDELERRVRGDFGEIVRIVGHADPLHP